MPIKRCIIDPYVLPRLRLFAHASRSAVLRRPEHLRELSNTLTGAHICSIPIFTNLPDVQLNLSAGARSHDGGTPAPIAMAKSAQLQPLPPNQCVSARTNGEVKDARPVYGLHARLSVPTAGFISPFTFRVSSAGTYLANPGNQYGRLGVPKRYVLFSSPFFCID